MGTLWNRSGTIERYGDDIKADGARAYFYQGGTTNPLSVFKDGGESSAHTHPLLADANGRWPNVFIPYIESYDVRVVTKGGAQLTFTERIPNPDPVELSVTVDPNNTVLTGMIHCELVNGTRAGYVRLNGRTIGSATSGATERANADTAALFTYIWDRVPDTVAPVSGGRGASAAADFASNKAMVLPSFKGAGPVGLDDMGDVAGNFFSGLTFLTGSSTIPGSLIGANALTLTAANIPAHTHTGTTDAEAGHTHSGTTAAENQSHTHSGTTVSDGAHQHDAFIGDDTHSHTVTFLSSSGGGVAQAGAGVAANNLQQSTSSVATGVKVRSTPGNAATADQKVASAGAHTHGFTSGNASQTHTHTFTTGAGSSHSHTFTTSSFGSGTPINNLGRSVLVTWFIKL